MNGTIRPGKKSAVVITAALAATAVGWSGWAAGAEVTPAVAASASAVPATALEPIRPAATLLGAKAGRTSVAEAAQLPRGRMLPVRDFRISAGWGHSSGPHAGREHAGLDMAAEMNEPVYAVSGGKVVSAGWAGGYGQMVKIRDEQGRFTMYAHLNKYNVKRGQRVAAGQRIGAVGSTGHSTGPHLHFEVHNKKDVATPPVKYLGVDDGDQLTAVAKKIDRQRRK